MRVVLETGKNARIYKAYLLLLISIPCYGNKIMPGKWKIHKAANIIFTFSLLALSPRTGWTQRHLFR